MRLLLNFLWLEHGAEGFPQVPPSVAGAQLDVFPPFLPLQCFLQVISRQIGQHHGNINSRWQIYLVENASVADMAIVDLRYKVFYGVHIRCDYVNLEGFLSSSLK